MKNLETFDEFINEGFKYNKKGLIDKFKEKLEIAKMAVEKWGESYEKRIPELEDIISGRTKPDYKKNIYYQGDSKKSSYAIFQGSNSMDLAKAIAKILKKYKKYEVKADSIAAAGGWSGTMRSTRSGFIEGIVNTNTGRDSWLIGVKIGSNVDSAIQEKLKQELYEVMFILDEFNSSDGGVQFDTSTGTNYDTVGLKISGSKFNSSYAEKLQKILDL